jgi:hypothetical protein
MSAKPNPELIDEENPEWSIVNGARGESLIVNR